MVETNWRERGRRQAEFESVLARYLAEVDLGEAPEREEFLASHPEMADELRATLEDHDYMRALVGGARLPSEPKIEEDVELEAGTRLGPYRIDGVVGKGGMGTIYLATHEHLNRVVAIKMLPKRMSEDTQFVERFMREARALAQLEHPNIVRIHDLCVEQGRHFFVMEYVEGVNLRQLMETEKLTPRAALMLVPQVCRALEYAHGRGIVHRDIKPENILVDRLGTPKIADFGLAKILGQDTSAANLTRSDVLMGTFSYMAPEQTRSPSVDHRADIYAIGVVLYEMLTGQLPVGRFDMPSLKTDVNAGIDEIVAKALEHEPERRYQTASQLGRDVSSLMRAPGRDTPLPGAIPGVGVPPPPSPDAASPAKPASGASASARMRRLDVIDVRANTTLQTLDVGWLWIHVRGSDRVRVTTWERDEVGVDLDTAGAGSKIQFVVIAGKMDSDELGLEEGGSDRVRVDETASVPAQVPPGITGELRSSFAKLVLPKKAGTLFVPAGLPILVTDKGGPIVLSALQSPTLATGKGKIEVQHHVGPLVVERSGDGRIWVSEVSTGDLRLSTGNGNVGVMNLRLDSGEGAIRTRSGSVSLGGDPDNNLFRYQARTDRGSIDASAGSQLTLGHHVASGHMGNGGGGLVQVDTYSGNIRVCNSSAMRRRLLFNDHTGELIGAIALFVFFVMRTLDEGPGESLPFLAGMVACLWRPTQSAMRLFGDRRSTTGP